MGWRTFAEGFCITQRSLCTTVKRVSKDRRHRRVKHTSRVITGWCHKRGPLARATRAPPASLWGRSHDRSADWCRGTRLAGGPWTWGPPTPGSDSGSWGPCWSRPGQENQHNIKYAEKNISPIQEICNSRKKRNYFCWKFCNLTLYSSINVTIGLIPSEGYKTKQNT